MLITRVKPVTVRVPRGVSEETMAVTLPFSELRELGGYRIAVGLKPTPEELQYNRRGEAQRQ